MRSTEIFKRLVKRRSTQIALRGIQSSIGYLWKDLSSEFKYRQQLQNHCRGKTEILLNVGCGDLVQPGWVNIDFEPRPGAFFFNALDPLTIEDQRVKHIHAEHFLEHLEYEDAICFLGECYRVLKVGGTMRIVVPDAERYMRAYSSGDATFFDRLKELGGTAEPIPTKDAICNQMFRMGGDHRFAWDFETLEHVARKIGFKSIERSHYNDSSAPYCIDGQDWWRPIESLYAHLLR